MQLQAYCVTHVDQLDSVILHVELQICELVFESFRFSPHRGAQLWTQQCPHTSTLSGVSSVRQVGGICSDHDTSDSCLLALAYDRTETIWSN